MKEIQEELDGVVRSDRASTWEDKMNGSYLRVTIKGKDRNLKSLTSQLL